MGDAKSIESLAKKHNWTLTWMNDMKTELEAKKGGITPEWKEKRQGMYRKGTSNLNDVAAWTFWLDPAKFDKKKYEAVQMAAGISKLAAAGMEHPIAVKVGTKVDKHVEKHAPALKKVIGLAAGRLQAEVEKRSAK